MKAGGRVERESYRQTGRELFQVLKLGKETRAWGWMMSRQQKPATKTRSSGSACALKERDAGHRPQTRGRPAQEAERSMRGQGVRGRRKASPCEVQVNQAGDTSIKVFPYVINSGPHPAFKHHGTTDRKAVQTWVVFFRRVRDDQNAVWALGRARAGSHRHELFAGQRPMS